MKLSTVLLIAAFAGETVAKSWGFGKAAYNKWHETELERWLSDHNIPYSKPADRKDLEKIVQDNWQTKVVDSYKEWDSPQLQSYLTDTGKELDKKQKGNKNWLVEQVKSGWHETEKTAESAYDGVKDWIFDSWTESQLKAFLDRHGIPNPTPRTRDTLLAEARNNYDSVAKKLGETPSYPGNWLYESWSDSDLKRWLDEHGYPAPQPSNRDKLVAAVRRNSRLASHKANRAKESAKNTVSDTIFDTWSESKLKEFLDKNNVKVPQGSTKNELLALARRNKAYYKPESASKSASKSATSAYDKATGAYDKATAVGGDKVSQATDAAADYSQAAFDKVIEQWSDTRLKAYLDSRGVPVPQASKRDELLAKVRLNKHKASTGFGAWTFDTWSYDNLKAWLEARGEKVSGGAAASRDELYSSASRYYSSASAAAASSASSASSAASKASGAGGSAASKATGSAASAASEASKSAASASKSAASAGSKATDSVGSAASRASEAVTDGPKEAYASVTSALAQATASTKDAAFETWSDSDLKAYLDTYGIKTYQGSTRNEWIAMARRNAHYFRYGSEDQGVWGQAKSSLGYLQDQISRLMGKGVKSVEKGGDRVYESAQAASNRAKESAASVSHRAEESATYASHRSKEEL